MGNKRKKNLVTRTCSFCGLQKEIPACHSKRIKNWSCSTACGLAFRKTDPHAQAARNAAASKAIKAKWTEDEAWAAKRRAEKAANKRPEPLPRDPSWVPLVRYQYLHARGMPCGTCGRMILDRPGDTQPHWFCDYRCSGDYKSTELVGENSPRYLGPPVILNCAYCKVDFPRPTVFVGDWANHFCIKEHHHAWQKENYRPNPHNSNFREDLPQLVEAIKKLADEGLHKAGVAAQLGLPLGVLHSITAMQGIAIDNVYKYPTGPNHKRWIERVTLICAVCGKKFKREPWRVVGDKSYCGNTCRGLSARKEGVTQSRGPDWKHQRELAMLRDDYTCQLCGTPKGASIDVHHIKPFRLFKHPKAANKLKNLVCFCRSCHLRVEGTTDRANILTWREHYLAHCQKRIEKTMKKRAGGEPGPF